MPLYYANLSTPQIVEVEAQVARLLHVADPLPWFERPLWLDDLRTELRDLDRELLARGLSPLPNSPSPRVERGSGGEV